MGCPRLLKEYREIKSAKVVDKEIELELTDETDIFQWTARIQGPKDSPYEGGTFELSLKCPDSYPLAPPKVLFVTPVFHPNVLYKTGEICLDILKPDAWTPAWTLQSVCRAVAALLSHPEADSPLYARQQQSIERPEGNCRANLTFAACAPFVAQELRLREFDSQWRPARI